MPRPEELRSAAGKCDNAANDCAKEEEQVEQTIAGLKKAINDLLDPWYGQARTDFYQLWDDTVDLANDYTRAVRDTRSGFHVHAGRLRELATSIEAQEREKA